MRSMIDAMTVRLFELVMRKEGRGVGERMAEGLREQRWWDLWELGWWRRAMDWGGDYDGPMGVVVEGCYMWSLGRGRPSDWRAKRRGWSGSGRPWVWEGPMAGDREMGDLA